ncbi:MAG: purine-binding chemotaxis protein CheW [Candidatus Eisenbacteria bacterium]|nr:purine-binding chemotaxis protein CheW [Candidatus Eisenbacteria bacterium]MCC7140936.1 purine-binding chemotaxis protein CheW [Candidatus Eisenbacteria bacterium]
MSSAGDSKGSGLGGKYLTFTLGSETYGLEILKVQEIIGIMSVTRVPRTPEYIRGVINLRGKVIPVIELRSKFGMAATPDTERTCIVVVQLHQNGQVMTVGTIVDEVSEVAHLASDQITPPPSFGTGVNTEFILGMGQVADRVLTLLDIDRALSNQDLAEVESAAAHAA